MRKATLHVCVYGSGQVGTGVCSILGTRDAVDVRGPFGRERRETALRSGADVVVIATTSFLAEIAADVTAAIEAGSNVITTAEEAAYPWASDWSLATKLDALARSRNVTVLGAGLNPGFAFDALVLSVCGAARAVDSIRVQRVVDVSGFSEAVQRRIGVGHTPEAFEEGRQTGRITGHIGFPQSMHVVARALGRQIERIDRSLAPIVTERTLVAGSATVAAGLSAGFEQHYVAIVDGHEWFESCFTGHVCLSEVGLEPRDEIVIRGPTPLRFAAEPGMNPQASSSAIVANSIRRVVEAPPGWVTVAELPAAVPRSSS